MDNSKAVFTQECHREAFMGLCINVLPLIGGIIENARKSGVDGMVGLTVDTSGYISFDVYNSSWKMTKMDGESPAKIEYRYSEVVNVPEVKAEEKAVFEHLTENIMEITLVYANLQESVSGLCEIDSTTWKQKFVDWANEFESQWQEGRDSEYLEDIEKFARHKILEYAGLDESTTKGAQRNE